MTIHARSLTRALCVQGNMSTYASIIVDGASLTCAAWMTAEEVDASGELEVIQSLEISTKSLPLTSRNHFETSVHDHLRMAIRTFGGNASIFFIIF